MSRTPVDPVALPIEVPAEAAVYEPSYAQEQFWQWHEPGTALQNTAMAFVVHGRLSHAALERAFNYVVGRHDLLRTVLVQLDGRLVQRVRPTLVLPLEVYSVGAGDEPALEPALAYVSKEAARPLDVERGPLLRAGLIRTGPRCVLFLIAHHLVIDRWSCGVFLNELAASYAAFLHGTTLALPALPLQYHQYARQHRDWLAGPDCTRQLAYWHTVLAGTLVPATLFAGTVPGRRGAEVTARAAFEWPGDVAEAVRAAARRCRVTPFMLGLAALKIVILKYTGQEDTCVLCPIAGRRRVEWESLIGFLMNAVVIRSRHAGSDSCESVLHAVRDAALEAYAHQDVPIKKLMGDQPAETIDAVSRVTFQMAPLPQLRLSGLETDYIPLIMKTSPRSARSARHLSLTVLASPNGDARRWVASFEYDAGRCDPQGIEMLWRHYLAVLSQICVDPRQSVASAMSGVTP